MRTCNVCGDTKPLEDFAPGKKYAEGRRPTCRACMNEWHRKNREANPGPTKRASARYHERNREARNAQWREWYRRTGYHRFKQYGLTPEALEELFKSQGGCCAICGRALDLSIIKSDPRRVDVDHCHEQGHVRALLCHQCNMGLGAFRDDPALMRKAARYVEAHRR